MMRFICKGVVLTIMAVAALSAVSARETEKDASKVTAKSLPNTAAPVTAIDSAIVAIQALLAGDSIVVGVSPEAGERVEWYVIGSGGQSGASTNWIVNGTVGETATGEGTSTNYVVRQGYWQDFGQAGPSCCVGVVGDVNGDGDAEPSLGDVALLIDAKYISLSCDAIPCLAEADINQSGGTAPTCDDLSLGDVAILIDYMFITGPSLGLAECL